MIYIFAGLVLLCLFYSWRQSKTGVDPDWAMFNLPGFVGSHYGRDFADCKTPAIHYTYWLISKIVGKDVPRVKFLYHLLVSSFGLIYFAITHDPVGSLVFIVMINSGWLLSFHGNVDAIPAGLLLIALGLHNPLLSAGLIVIAILYDPKILPTAFALTITFGIGYFEWLVGGLALCALCFSITYLFNKKLAYWLYESSVIVPAKMLKYRKGWFYEVWLPSFTATGYLYILPWILAGVLSNPSLTFWLPAAVYAISIGIGRVVRQIHTLPLVAFAAVSGITPIVALALVMVDWISSGFHFGDAFTRWYSGLYVRINEAADLGRHLSEKEGTLWVNCLDTEIYIYAQKPVPYGMAEQIEVCTAVPQERVDAMTTAWEKDPPRWVVMTDDPTRAKFGTGGYKIHGKSASGMFTVWEKI
jgi:hypothetical protein